MSKKIVNAIVSFLFPGLSHYLYKKYLMGVVILTIILMGSFTLRSYLLETYLTFIWIWVILTRSIAAYLAYRIPEEELKFGPLAIRTLLYFISLIVIGIVRSFIFTGGIVFTFSLY